MIALAAAATTMFSFGDLPTGTSFESESLTTGDKTVADIVDYDDAGTKDGTLYWFSTADDTEALGVVTNEAPYTGTMRPQAYKDAPNANYLTLDTSTPLYRTINGKGDASAIADVEGTEIGDGLYLDTLVKFTAADSTNDLQLAEGDKIAISYVVEDMDDDGDGVYLTNFVVRAGYVNGSGIDKKNYVMDAINDFDSTVWHRLTVRAISDVGSSAAPVGFVVYVDGVALTYSTDVAAGDSDYVGSLNAAVAQNLYNSEKHALLPSTVNSGSAKTTLSAVAFKGNGSIDDISFTPNTPSFISDSEKKTVAFTIPAGVTSLTIDGVDYYDVEGVATTNIAFAADDADFSLVIGCAQDYTVSAVEVTGCSYSVADGTYTVAFSAASATFAISTTRGNFAYVVGGETLKAATLAAALSAADADSTITLMYDYDVSDWESLSEASPVYTISKNVTLDLNGKVLDGGSSDYRLMFSTAPNCTLTVIDSNNEGTGTITYGGTYGIFGGTGDVIIGSNDAGVTDYGPIINGSAIGSDGWITIVYRGKFTYAENTTEGGEFTCDSDSADGVEAVDWEVSSVAKDSEESPEYWVVTVNGAATTYKLTIPEVTGATATVTDADEQEISDLTAIAEGTVVTVTWAPSTGYKITAGETEEITMDANKTAKEPTVVAITYATLTITQVENCTIVVSNATEEVASGATFDVDDETQLTVYRTPANGYKLSSGYAATETITMNANVTVTAVVEEDSEEPVYPSYIDGGDAVAKDKYDTWKSYVEGASETVGDGEALADAYLLNCKPSEVEAAKAAFKFTSISYDSTQSKWVTPTTTSYNEREYNGTVTVKQYSDVGCTTESSTGTFFKAVLQ